jgi:hypothetical protein
VHVAAVLSPLPAARRGQRTRRVTEVRGALAGHDGLAYRRAARKFSGEPWPSRFPESQPKCRAARNRLLDQEIELRRGMEAVADAGRRLPPGGVVPEDYAFQAQGPDGGPGRGAAVRAVRAGQELAGDLQHDVSQRRRRYQPWPAGRANRVAALGGGPVPVVHRPARSTGRRGRSGAAASQMITGTTQTMWWVQVTGDTT